jgi:type IV pilus assembly protein PilW
MTSPNSKCIQNSGVFRQTGLSLVELLVAIALGLVLLAGIGTIYMGSQQTYRMQEANARLQENGRYALEIIGRSLRQAGADGVLTPNLTAVAAECTAPACTPISGANNTTVVVVNGNNVSTDSFTVQFYAGMDELLDMNDDGDFSDADIDCYGSRDSTGRRACGCMIKSLVQCEVVNNVVGNQFLLQQTSAADAPELAVVGTVNNAGALTARLLSGVEDLQVIYGVDADSNQSADIYTANPTAAQWPNVVTAKVCVMLFSIEQGLATTSQRPLDCPRALGMATGQPNVINDTRLHRAFVATFNLRNRVTKMP